MEVIEINPSEYDISNSSDRRRLSRQLAPAIQTLMKGGIVAFPTETVYGLGVLATDAAAVQRLRVLKGRPKSPFTVHISKPSEVRWYVKDVPVLARALIYKAWPGAVTILLPVDREFPKRTLRDSDLFNRIAPEGIVGLRCPDDPIAQVLLGKPGKPILATSANYAGQKPATSGKEVIRELEGKVDVLIDAGPTRYKKASTIVSFCRDSYRIVREGVYDANAIAQLTSRRILFVCTGNTCRSPMAAALARKMLAEQIGCSEDELERFGQEILSAGVWAVSGSRASDYAFQAVAKFGGHLEKHHARKLTSSLINWADVIFCMCRRHVDEVIQKVPDAAGKTFLLDESDDIKDPIGGNLQKYLQVAKRIRRNLNKRVKENLL